MVSRSEPRAERDPIRPRRWLGKESADGKGVRAGPCLVRVYAMTAIPPHDILARNAQLRATEAEASREPLGYGVRERDLPQAHIVARVDGVEDAPVLRNRVGLGSRRAVRIEELQILIGAALANSIRTITVAEHGAALHRHESVKSEVPLRLRIPNQPF